MMNGNNFPLKERRKLAGNIVYSAVLKAFPLFFTGFQRQLPD